MLIISSVGTPIVKEDNIRKMILAGADVLRYNLSYYDAEKIVSYINIGKKIKEELNSDVKILIDFPLNKILLGEFENEVFGVQEDQELLLQSATYSSDCQEFIPVDTTHLGEKVYINQTISLANGRVSLQVVEIINKDAIRVRVLNNGVIKSKLTFNNGICVGDEEMLKQYKFILENIFPIKPNYIAVSYLNENFINELKNLPEMQKLKDDDTKIVIKIEKEITNAELEKLCQDNFFSIILIDRGEIGVNIPFEKTGVYQKKLTQKIKQWKKPLFISTQILNSTIDNYIPARSDILDLTNIILDGADGIVLTKETSMNKRPIYAISVAKKIIAEVNSYKTYGN